MKRIHWFAEQIFRPTLGSALRFLTNIKKIKKNNFLLHLKSTYRSGHVGKRFHKKAKIDFKIYDVINRETNNYNRNIAQYLKK